MGEIAEYQGTCHRKIPILDEQQSKVCFIGYIVIKKFALLDLMFMMSSVTGTLKVTDIVHLELKRAERLDHVAEDEQQVAHAQGAEQRVEQTFHHPE